MTLGYLQIARRLLGKILIDLRNTREEAINVAELKSGQSQTSTTSITNVKEHIDHQPMSLIRNEESRRTSFTSEKSMDQDEDDDKKKEACVFKSICLVYLVSCTLC